AVDLDVLFAIANHHAVVVGHDTGGGNDLSGKLLAHGFNISYFHEIGVGFGGALAAGSVVRKDDVGADAFNLLQDVIAAGERDCDDENHRGDTDHHAQGGENGTDGIGAQRLCAEFQGFFQEHLRISFQPA